MSRRISALLFLGVAFLAGCQGQPDVPVRLEAERGEAIGETLLYLHNTSEQVISELSFKPVNASFSPMVIATSVQPGQVARCGVSGSAVDTIAVSAEGNATTTIAIPSVPESEIDTSGYDFAELPTWSLD